VPLYHAVRGKYRIFCKVRLADVVCCPRGQADERRWFKKIGRYHVDFVICDPKTTAPLLVIELDDRRHRERRAKARDEFKDAVLRAAGMPVYRLAAQQAYDVVELQETIAQRTAGRDRVP
jgi:very-short-patch-repair endonuclease